VPLNKLCMLVYQKQKNTKILFESVVLYSIMHTEYKCVSTYGVEL
jgi:hypothetical protein